MGPLLLIWQPKLVETTSVTEPSSTQEKYSAAPDRVYYRLTKEGIKAGEEFWSNPLFTLYPEISPSHMKQTRARRIPRA
jgi:DNA-binding PadR family transcriptional regulator